MPNIYCVRADFGRYADQFKNGNYVAIGWFDNLDLSDVKEREELKELYREHHPEDTNERVIGQQVGQIFRFLIEMKPGDHIVTPTSDTEYLYYGILEKGDYSFVEKPTDGNPFKHRRQMKWIDKIQRSVFSIPLQYTLRSSLTVFEIKHKNSFFEEIGRNDLVPKEEIQTKEKNTKMVLKKVLELDYTEFEMLITNLLSALGFEAEHVGKVGDGGVDAKGELDLSNIAKVRLIAQAKRYNLNTKIAPKQVKDLRQNIPHNAQGAFITTCDFQKKALEIATQPGFPRIGTINGEQLVDLLAEKWDSIDDGLKEKLGLKKGLILE